MFVFEQNFVDLLHKISRHSERYLIQNANKVVHCESWACLAPQVQKRIKDGMCIYILCNFCFSCMILISWIRGLQPVLPPGACGLPCLLLWSMFSKGSCLLNCSLQSRSDT